VTVGEAAEMEDYSLQHYLLGLLAVANNIPAIPIFLELCSDLNRDEQKKLASVAAGASLLTMLIAMGTGALILKFFEISIQAFRIAGGLLLMITGVNMVNARTSESEHMKKLTFSETISVAVIPVAIPLTTGAGTISTVILFAESLPTWRIVGFLVAAIMIVTLINYVLFRWSLQVVKFLGETGMNVLTKVFGLITLALGVQFVLTGVGNSFPGLLK